MRNIAVAAFAVLALAGRIQAAPGIADDTEHVTRTLTLEPGGTLRLNNFSGHVTVTGTERSEVVIDATRRGTRSQLDRIKLDIQTSGNTVSIDANRRDDSWWGFKSHNVVETDFGYHIIKVIEKQPARTVPLDEVKPKIEQFLESRNREQQTTAFVNGLRSKGKIEVFI